MNVELCKMATSQRIIEVPDGEPFICPRCSTDLAPVSTRRTNPALRAIQVAAILIGIGGIGAKVYLDNRPKPPAAPADAVPIPVAPRVEKAAAAIPVAAPAPPTPAAVPFLRLIGADILARHAGARLAASYLAAIGDTDIHVQAGATPDSTIIVGQQAGASEAIAITSSTTPAAFAALAGHQADIALALRAPSTDEARAIGDAASAERAIGVAAYAVVANPAVRVASLTRAQLAAVYAGKITNWSDLGAPVGEIHAYLVGGQKEGAASLLLDDPAQAKAARTAQDDAAVVDAVSHDAAAIGLVEAQTDTTLRMVPVGEKGAASAPTEAGVAAGDYPLSRHAGLYGEQHGAAGRFASYAVSAAGQLAVQAAGLAVAPAPAPAIAHPAPNVASAPVAAVTSDRFKRFVDGAALLPFVFHFEPGSVQLDRAALRDIDRLATYLRAQHIGGDKLLLAGFSDSAGTPAVREYASQKRVSTVSAALARTGIVPARSAGFGADVPVADDATTDGGSRNRRVEVYAEP